MDLLPDFIKTYYDGDFLTADWGIVNRRREVTTTNWEKYWNHWKEYVRPAGVDPYLEGTPFQQKVHVTNGFVGRFCCGTFGLSRPVGVDTVCAVLGAINLSIALDT